MDYDEFIEKNTAKREEFGNIYELYQSNNLNPSKIRKFTFEMMTNLNQCQLEFREVPLDKFDSVEVKYRLEDQGEVNPDFFMEFLHHSFKEDNFILNSSKNGSWATVRNFYSTI